MSKKPVLPNTLELEELLNQINNENLPSNKEEQITSSLFDFLSFYNINAGDTLVNKRALYKLYQAWAKDAYDYNYSQFSGEMSLLFETKGICVRLNTDAITLSKKAKAVFFKKNVTQESARTTLKPNIEKFLKQYGIVSGDYAVNSYALYFIFEEWILSTKKRVIPYVDFSNIMKYFIKYHRDGVFSPMYFYVDKQQLKVDGVTLEKAKKWAEKKSSKKSKGKDKTRKNQKTKPEEKI